MKNKASRKDTSMGSYKHTYLHILIPTIHTPAQIITYLQICTSTNIYFLVFLFVAVHKNLYCSVPSPSILTSILSPLSWALKACKMCFSLFSAYTCLFISFVYQHFSFIFHFSLYLNFCLVCIRLSNMYIFFLTFPLIQSFYCCFHFFSFFYRFHIYFISFQFLNVLVYTFFYFYIHFSFLFNCLNL